MRLIFTNPVMQNSLSKPSIQAQVHSHFHTTTQSKSPRSPPSDIQTKSRGMLSDISKGFLDVVLINNYACIRQDSITTLISCKVEEIMI